MSKQTIFRIPGITAIVLTKEKGISDLVSVMNETFPEETTSKGENVNTDNPTEANKTAK